MIHAMYHQGEGWRCNWLIIGPLVLLSLTSYAMCEASLTLLVHLHHAHVRKHKLFLGQSG